MKSAVNDDEGDFPTPQRDSESGARTCFRRFIVFIRCIINPCCGGSAIDDVISTVAMIQGEIAQGIEIDAIKTSANDRRIHYPRSSITSNIEFVENNMINGLRIASSALATIPPLLGTDVLRTEALTLARHRLEFQAASRVTVAFDYVISAEAVSHEYIISNLDHLHEIYRFRVVSIMHAANVVSVNLWELINYIEGIPGHYLHQIMNSIYSNYFSAALIQIPNHSTAPILENESIEVGDDDPHPTPEALTNLSSLEDIRPCPTGDDRLGSAHEEYSIVWYTELENVYYDINTQSSRSTTDANDNSIDSAAGHTDQIQRSDTLMSEITSTEEYGTLSWFPFASGNDSTELSPISSPELYVAVHGDGQHNDALHSGAEYSIYDVYRVSSRDDLRRVRDDSVDESEYYDTRSHSSKSVREPTIIEEEGDNINTEGVYGIENAQYDRAHHDRPVPVSTLSVIDEDAPYPENENHVGNNSTSYESSTNSMQPNLGISELDPHTPALISIMGCHIHSF